MGHPSISYSATHVQREREGKGDVQNSCLVKVPGIRHPHGDNTIALDRNAQAHTMLSVARRQRTQNLDIVTLLTAW